MVDLSAEEIEDLLTPGYEPDCKRFEDEYNQHGIRKILLLIKGMVEMPKNQHVGGDSRKETRSEHIQPSCRFNYRADQIVERITFLVEF